MMLVLLWLKTNANTQKCFKKNYLIKANTNTHARAQLNWTEGENDGSTEIWTCNRWPESESPDYQPLIRP